MRTKTHNGDAAIPSRASASGVIYKPQHTPRNPRPSVPGSDLDQTENVVIASLIVLLVTGGFLFSSDRFYHWFLIPLMICGVLSATDAVAWVRGRLDLYDLIGIVGVFGFHFFFLAPLLHVQLDFWVEHLNPPPDWRDWLGYMAILNVAGLVSYRLCRNVFKTSKQTSPRRGYWRIDPALFRVIAPVALAIAAVSQIWVYARMGGIGAYMQAVQSAQNPLQGMGWIFMVSESVGVLAMFILIVHFQNGNMSWSKAISVLLLLFIVQLIFAGLRGSRSQMIQYLFWLVGCVHFLVRPVPRKFIYAGSVFVVAFLYIYGFYKAGGAAGVTEAAQGSSEREQLGKKTGRTFNAVLLGDLGRSDMQAFVLYRLVHDRGDYSYALGRTYLGAVSVLIPHFILPERPETKVRWGTDIQNGSGRYAADVAQSSKVYGLAGESMLNFGPISVPFIYGVFGLLVGWIRNRISLLLPGDARFLLVPLVLYTCFQAIIGDSDNLIFGLVKDGFMPCIVVMACSLRGSQLVSSLGRNVQPLAPAVSASYGARGSMASNPMRVQSKR
jgi:hypothetical protein